MTNGPMVLASPTEKLAVKFRVAHPNSARPKVKMAKVAGCTFFKKKDGGWRHVDNSCSYNEHWVWMIQIRIGECLLARGSEGVNGVWFHKDGDCEAVGTYLVIPEKIQDLEEQIAKNDQLAADLEVALAMLDPDDFNEKAEDQLLKIYAETAELLGKILDLEAAEPPACMPDNDAPVHIGQCKFVPSGVIFHHTLDFKQNGKGRCKEKKHSGGKTHVATAVRKPGWQRDEFEKRANEAIGQTLAMVPPGIVNKATVEVPV